MKPVIDSRINFEEAVYGTAAPESIISSLCLMDVCYFSFDGRLHQGQLVIHQSLKKDMEEIFAIIEKSRFPVAKAIPIVKYGWSDDASMADNNTSAFNYRFVAGTKNLSRHAWGMAVDINPFQNPVIYQNGISEPVNAVYAPSESGSFSEDHPIVREFIRRGWHWGGHFDDMKDYHHFDKKTVTL
ncbi:MAG: M15 family metallopeptidase [Deltaproteobacteria bacterium]|nr:M15 family metallopeptidase [Deltaproteobacteria bacterium]